MSGVRRSISILRLCALAVVIFVLVSTIRLHDKLNSFALDHRRLDENNVSSCSGNVSTSAVKNDNWEIEPLPIMKSISNGFHPVYIYSKAQFERRPQYSQERQDKLVLYLLEENDKKANTTTSDSSEKKAPYFVDLASNDPLILSNTFLLEQNGWNGLCIEPNPKYWYGLAAYRKCTIVGAFVGGTPSEDGKEVGVTFSQSTGRKGGIVAEGMDNAGAAVEEKRNLVSILTIFRDTNVQKVIDYFSLDVEGAEALVMKDFPWDEYSFKVMTIERPQDELKAALQSHGYEMVRTISSYDETVWVNKKLVILSQAEIDEVAKRADVKNYRREMRVFVLPLDSPFTQT